MSEVREYGHVLTDAADFDNLRQLPAGVTFQVLRFTPDPRAAQSGRRPAKSLLKQQAPPASLWFVAVERVGSKNMTWKADAVPMAVMDCPPGGPEFVKRAREQAGPYFHVVRQIHETAVRAHCPAGFGEEQQVGAVSLSLQIASLLDRRILTLVSDPNHDVGIACLTEPGNVMRIRCECLGTHVLCERGSVEVSPLSHTPLLLEFVERLASITGVRKAPRPPGYRGNTLKELVAAEYNAFVGGSFSDHMEEWGGVTPEPRTLTPVARRMKGGTVKHLGRA